ncbi:MAG TPA: nucleotidyltransferase domain-containing protein [Azospirillum sp.]|nr:nucleotidyltransferase domain-containing protein [Azospirillum sp.]
MGSVSFTPDHFLVKFRRAVEEAFGDKVERVVLFGSRARGDARPDSDWDVAVFLKEGARSWDTLWTLSGIAVDIGSGDGNKFIQTVRLDASNDDQATELRDNIRRDGIEVPRL